MCVEPFLHELAVLVRDAALLAPVDEIERAIERHADPDGPALDQLVEVAGKRRQHGLAHRKRQLGFELGGRQWNRDVRDWRFLRLLVAAARGECHHGTDEQNRGEIDPCLHDSLQLHVRGVVRRSAPNRRVEQECRKVWPLALWGIPINVPRASSLAAPTTDAADGDAAGSVARDTARARITIHCSGNGGTCPTNLPTELLSPIGPGGFEPPFSDPKSDVLPLDEGPVRSGKFSGAGKKEKGDGREET